MKRFSPQLLRSLWRKALLFGVTVLAAAVNTAPRASAAGIAEDRPVFQKVRQVGDVIEVEFNVPASYGAYHMILHGPGQNSAQTEVRASGTLTHHIRNVLANRKYSIAIQSVRKNTGPFAKDDCSEWVERSLTTHEIAQEIRFGKNFVEPVEVIVHYQLNDKWHFKTIKLEQGIPFEAPNTFHLLTDNTKLYYYAKGLQTGKLWDGTNNFTYNGKTLGFRPYNTGSGWDRKSVILKP